MSHVASVVKASITEQIFGWLRRGHKLVGQLDSSIASPQNGLQDNDILKFENVTQMPNHEYDSCFNEIKPFLVMRWLGHIMRTTFDCRQYQDCSQRQPQKSGNSASFNNKYRFVSEFRMQDRNE